VKIPLLSSFVSETLSGYFPIAFFVGKDIFELKTYSIPGTVFFPNFRTLTFLEWTYLEVGLRLSTSGLVT
jgi:hypothetical protein